MHALVLLTCLAIAADDDKLFKQLDADFEELLEKEKNPQRIRQAARILESAPERYAEAVETLRRTRARAGVPLLLKYLVQHADISDNGYEVSAYGDALAILAGVELADLSLKPRDERKKAARATVEKLVKHWWRKDRILTDPAEMDKDHLWTAVSRLVGTAGREPDDKEREGAWSTWNLVNAAVAAERSAWWREELHPAMIPVLLGPTDFAEEAAPPKNRRDSGRIAFGAIPFLAALRKSGEADSLSRIAQDAKENSATRITCLLALAGAGEPIKTDLVVSLLEGEKKLDRRLTLLNLLGHSTEPQSAGAPLIKVMDDPNLQVRVAALYVLARHKPKDLDPKVLPRCRVFLRENPRGHASAEAMQLVASFRTREAQAILAEWLETNLEHSSDYNFGSALEAFAAATGRKVPSNSPGLGYNGAAAKKTAQEALAWWKKQQ